MATEERSPGRVFRWVLGGFLGGPYSRSDSGPSLIRPPIGNGKSGLIRGVASRCIVDTIIQDFLSEIVAL